MSVTRRQAIDQGDLDALATRANAKLAPASAYDFTGGNWLTELNRIRSDLFDLYTGLAGVYYNYTQSLTAVADSSVPRFVLDLMRTMSGPWAVKVTGSGGGTLTVDGLWNFSDVSFWYPAASSPAPSASTGFINSLGSPVTILHGNILDNLDSEGKCQHIKTYVRIGGEADGVLTTDASSDFGANTIVVYSRRISGAAASSLTVTTDIPGATIGSVVEGAGVAHVVITLPAGVISPAVYTLDATEASGWYFYVNLGDTFKSTGLNFTLPSESLTTSVDQPGLDTSGDVSKITFPDNTLDATWPFGLYVAAPVTHYYPGDIVDAVSGERVTPVGDGSDPAVYEIKISTPRWTVACAGVFTAKTIPVSRENAEIDKLVPWTKHGSGSWMREAAPAADTATIKSVTPAINYRMGRWPAVHESEAAGVTAAFGSVAGCCVFAVTARRLSVESGQIYLPPATAPAITVNIGYYAGGGVVPLTTIAIAADEMEATADVFWPVLAGCILVYSVAGDATQKLLVHAFANNQPPYTNSVSTPDPRTATYPVAACLYNDIYNLLGLLPDAV